MRYSNTILNSICPICSNTQNNRLLYSVSSTEAAKHFLLTHGINDSGLKEVVNKVSDLWHNDSASVINCAACGFVFADPFIAGDYEFYNLLPHAQSESPENWKWEFNKTFKKISSLAKQNDKLSLLEIGASTGDFVKRIARVIDKKNIFCLEHSEIGIKSIQKAGIAAQSFHFHDLRHKQEFSHKFDIICLFQVLEHLDKIDETFKTFNEIIKPGGHLFIGVPNGKKIRFNELNDALLDMPPNHIGRYNDKVFKFLGEKHGWKIEETAIEPYSPLDVMKTVMYFQSLKRAQFPFKHETRWYLIKQYLSIKKMQIQSYFMHKQLGESLWIHYQKVS